MGCKMVWMPNPFLAQLPCGICGIARRQPRRRRFLYLDAQNKLVPEIAKILAIIKQYDMVLANGHYLAAGNFRFVRSGAKDGHRQLVVTHGLWTKRYGPFYAADMN